MLRKGWRNTTRRSRVRSAKIHELQKMNLFGTPHIPIRVLTFGPKSGSLGFNTTLLGLIINDTLTWNDHVEELVKKASKKLYFLIQLKRAHVPTSDLVTYFCACIRSSLDHACPVFHYSLPKYLQVELESVQRRALSCIFPRVHYSDVLQLAGVESIRTHQKNLTEDLFKSIVKDPRSKITSLLPPLVSTSNELRRQRRFAMPPVKTNRFGNSFIVKSAKKAFK